MSGRCVWFITRHFNNAVIDVDLVMINKPTPDLTQSHAVPHGHRASANKALPTLLQRQPFYGTTGGIRAIQYPNRFAMRGRCLKHIEQRRNKRINPAAQILKVYEDNIKGLHRLAGRAPHFAIEAVYRDTEHRVGEVW